MEALVELPQNLPLFGGISLYLTLGSAALLLIAIVALLYCLGLAVQAKLAAIAVPALIAGIAVAATAWSSLLASPHHWTAMLAAYSSASPESRALMSREIKRVWMPFHEHVRMRDWLSLSESWGICHELWRQTSCTPTAQPREAEGIARERLTRIANDA